MADLTSNRMTKMLAAGAASFVDPVAAGVHIYQGAMVALDAAGNAVPAAPASAVMRGCAADYSADNTGGAAGALNIETMRGVFLFNQTGLDRTDIGSDVFVVDDNTVGAAGTLIAGKLLDISSEGAWVEIS